MASSTLQRILSYSGSSDSDSDDIDTENISTSIDVSKKKDYLRLIDIEAIAKIQLSLSGSIRNSSVVGSPSSTETLLLGTGGSFVVRRVSNTAFSHSIGTWDEDFDVSKRFVVVKQPSVREGDDDFENRLYDTMMELKVSHHAPIRKHPNIVHLHSFMWDIHSNNADAVAPSLIMEYADLGTVSDFQNSDKLILHADAKLQICLDVAEGLSFLNQCGVVHGDVKSENIFLFRDLVRDNQKVTAIRAKIGDFGSAIIGVSDDPDRPKQTLRGYSPPWDAPERENDMNAISLWRMDMYSYGLTVWRIMCNGKMTYKELFWDSARRTVLSKPTTAPAKTLSMIEFIALKKKDDMVLRLAIDTLKDRPKSDINLEKVRRVLEVTICNNPNSRASNFEEVANILRVEDGKQNPKCNLKPELLKEGNLSIDEPRLPHFLYLLRPTPLSFRSLICEEITKKAENAETQSQRALYHLVLGVCYWQKFYPHMTSLSTTLSNDDLKTKGAAEIFKAAELGNPIAQSLAPKAACFLRPHTPISHAILEDWLVNSMRHGSIRARNLLRTMSLDKFNEASITIHEIRQKVASKLSSDKISPYSSEFFDTHDLDPAAKATLCRPGINRLHQAAYLGAISVCQQLVEKFSCDIDVLDNQNETPFLYAMRNAQLVVGQYLLDKGCNINAQRQGGAGALHLAFCSYETEKTINFLLKRGADQEIACTSNLDPLHDGCDYFVSCKGTPLHLSIRCENLEAALVLLKHGANLIFVTDYVGSPLSTGIEMHSIPILELLMPWAIKRAKPSVIMEELYTSLVGFYAQPMHRYVYWRDERSLPFILSAIPSFEKYGLAVDKRVLLDWALDADDVEVVDHFLKELFDTDKVIPDASQEYSTHHSDWLLITMDLPHVAARKNIFTTVLSTGSKEMIKLVLQYVKKPIPSHDDMGMPIISHIGLRAAEPREDLSEILSWLVEAGVSLKETDDLGNGPLQNAVGWNNANVADILLEHEPASEDVQKTIEVCVAKGNSLTVETIMRSIFCKFPQILTAPLPAKQQEFDFMNILSLVQKHDPNYLRVICRGSEFSQQKNFNATTLQEAIQSAKQYPGGELAIQERLVDYDILSMAPIHHAAANGNLEAVQILLDTGSNINAYSIVPIIGSEFDVSSFTCTSDLSGLNKEQRDTVMVSSGPTPLDCVYYRDWFKSLSRWLPADRQILTEIRCAGGANKEELKYDERTKKMVDLLRANGARTRLEIFGYGT